MDKNTLVTHSDIQAWVTARKGQPALQRVPDETGEVKPKLAIRFRRHDILTETPSQDDGISPVSWKAWLAELDRQRLALRVSDQAGGFEFVERRTLN